jgi:hypothetical protein
MKYNLEDLVIKDQDLEGSTQLDASFFKYSGLTRCLFWLREFTKSIPTMTPPVKIVIGLYLLSVIILFLCRYYWIKNFDIFNKFQLIIIKLVPILIIPIGIFLLFLSLILVIELFILTFGFIVCIIQAVWFHLTRYRTLKGILKEIKKYNQLIVDFYRKDKSMDFTIKNNSMKDRQRIIEALQLTRLDLIRALKAEKKLWDKTQKNQLELGMFVNSLDALEALKLREQSSEYKPFLDTALQVVINLEKNMNKLYNLTTKSLE